MHKSFAVGIVATIIAFAGAAIAQDTKAPAASASKPAAAKAAGTTNAMPSMAQMDEHMKKMQAAHDRMMRATTPEERQKATDEHRKEMHESMDMMNQMMRGGDAMGGMMGQRGKPADANAQMQMMSRRMDMMQMMMQMMMDQQQMTMRSPSGATSASKK